jgi:8-oxo-dGTP pyrophosphatase MutT (NUDIX family)
MSDDGAPVSDGSAAGTARHWRVLASKITFEDRWLKIRTDHCAMADGTEVNPYHVIESRDWTAVVALTTDLKLVMIREYRHARSRIIDGVPGGVIDHGDGQTALDAAEAGARRELREETGYGGGAFFPILTTYPDPGNQSNIATAFLAVNVEPMGAQSLDSTEAIDIYLADFPDVLMRVARGDLRLHAVHVAALWSAAGRILLADEEAIAAATAPLRARLVAAFTGLRTP